MCGRVKVTGYVKWNTVALEKHRNRPIQILSLYLGNAKIIIIRERVKVLMECIMRSQFGPLSMHSNVCRRISSQKRFGEISSFFYTNMRKEIAPH